MSSADYYAPERTEAECELLNRGRAATRDALAAIAGRGAAAEWREELDDVERATPLDKFVVRAGGAQFSTAQRAALERYGDCEYFAGGATAHVLVAQAAYDTRWLALDFTREQRRLACAALCFAALALVGALWLRFERAPLHSHATYAAWLFDEPLEWAPAPAERAQAPLADEL